MWLTPKEVEVTGLMISLVSDAYHIALTKAPYFTQFEIVNNTLAFEHHGVAPTNGIV